MSVSVRAGVQKVLRDKDGLIFSQDWFKQCVDWVIESNPGTVITHEFLRQEVYDQWKDVNLTLLEAKSLPDKLSDQKCAVLKGRYTLQINSIEDIGESAYSQYNKLKKLTNENTSVSASTESSESKPTWEPKPRRCLYLTMTDGTQSVCGIEMVSIPVLNVEEKPGCKIVVTGPLECRRGVMHLKPNNVRVIGGEVEDLVQTNSMELMLQARLNQEQQSKTNGRANGIGSRPTYRRPSSPKHGRKPGGNSTISTAPTQKLTQRNLPSTNPYNNSSSSSFKSASTNRTNGGASSSSDWPEEEEDPFGDDDIFMDIDETLLISQALDVPTQPIIPMSQQQPQPKVAPSNHQQQQSHKFVSNKRQPPPPKAPQNHRETQRRPVIDLVDDDDLGDDDFDVMLAGASHHELEPPPPKKSKSAPPAPYQYIKVIKDNLRKFQVGHIVSVKACVTTLVSGIKVDNGQWTLTVSLNDGSGYLDAKMIPELLNKIIGFSPADMKKMKLSADPVVKAKINTGLSNLSSTLVHMNGIFGIRIDKSHLPVVASFSNIESQHVSALKKRLEILV